MRSGLAALLLLCIFLSACTPNSSTDQVSQAEETLTDFFQFLADGDYRQAAELYGGDYDQLRDMNPSISPDDYESLWRSGCTVNGFQCLPVLKVVKAEQISEDEFLFTMEFAAADGSVFISGSCCGADESEAESLSQFEYHVIRSAGQYCVQETPIYIP